MRDTRYEIRDTGAESLAVVTGEDPEISVLLEEIKEAVRDAHWYYDRSTRASDVRFCKWAFQSDDGLKHSQEGYDAFPFEGASDGKVRTVDTIINQKVELLMLAWNRMTIQTIPMKAADAGWSAKVTTLLRWFLYNQMADEMRCEMELLANYMLTYGSAVASVRWRTDLGYEVKEISLEQIQAMAMQAGGGRAVEQLQEIVFNPAREDELVRLLQQFSSLITTREARAVVEDLRTGDVAEVPIPYIAENRPCVTALLPFKDVFFPVLTSRLQEARWIAEPELLTDTELIARKEGRDPWNKEFVDEVLEHRGETWDVDGFTMEHEWLRQEISGTAGNWEEARDLYQVWHFYHRSTFRNMPCIYHTVLHPEVPDVYGRHEMQPYKHGQFPYVEFVRERHSRTILSSRGIPEVSDTQQAEIKVQRDSRVDRSSITTLPPVKVKLRRAKVKHAFGPGAEIPVEKQDDLEPMLFGSPDPTSIEVERATKLDLGEYHGLRIDGVDPRMATQAEQALVDRWLGGLRCVGTQTLQLAQQYLEEIELSRVVGNMQKQFRVTGKEIRGKFDLVLTFDTRFSNEDFVFKFLENTTKFLFPIDKNAVLDHDVIIRWALASINPTLADHAVREAESASQAEVEDEMLNLSLMFSGQEPPMKLKGQNYQLRLQVLQNAFQKNPTLVQMRSARPDFNEILQQRVEFLTHQVEQQQNAVIGAYGTLPGKAVGAR